LVYSDSSFGQSGLASELAKIVNAAQKQARALIDDVLDSFRQAAIAAEKPITTLNSQLTASLNAAIANVNTLTKHGIEVAIQGAAQGIQDAISADAANPATETNDIDKIVNDYINQKKAALSNQFNANLSSVKASFNSSFGQLKQSAGNIVGQI